MPAARRRAPRPPVPREGVVLRGVQMALARRHDVIVWRQNSGVSRMRNKKGPERFVRFGVVGAADLTGIVVGSGRRLEIECKRPGEHPTENQLRYGDRIRGAGGFYLVVHSVEECLRLLDEALDNEIRP